MYDNWGANVTVTAATLAAVILCVLVHYEGLVLTSRRLQQAGGRQRVKVLYGMLSTLTLHVVEIWVFGITLWLLLKWPACGQVTSHAAAAGPLGLFDSVYFSAMTYSTVGYGDVLPLGPVRLLAGTEGLIGLVLIGWSASFTYIEMERFWRER